MKTPDTHFPTYTKINCTNQFDSILSSLIPTTVDYLIIGWGRLTTAIMGQWKGQGDYEFDGGLQYHSGQFYIPNIHKVLP
jgi:hypothetical protein